MTASGPPILSHSAISMYQECPLKYKFRYVERIPQEPRSYFSFGKSVHKALEFFYDTRVSVPAALNVLLAHYEKHWEKEGYKNPDEESAYKEEGRRILREFWTRASGDFHPALFTEYTFLMDVDGVKVRGIVDKIDKLPSGGLHITDYKTGRAFDLNRVEKDPQLTLYQMACEKNLGLPVENLTLFHLPSLTPFTVKPHNAALKEAVREKVVKTAESISRALFEPVYEEAKCSRCDYQRLCPLFRHKFLQEKDGADEAARWADEYGRLKTETKKADLRMEELREKIVEHCRKNNLRRLFGKCFEILYRPTTRYRFEDKSALERILKKAGLWENVLAPSPNLLNDLFEKEIPEETRKALEASGEKIDSAVLTVKEIDD